ncbi:4a-hydroxytetrahydrobiopterin dehydratase [uncultured Cytophaga sp.]|uniref:4a-hydroxytetrahydrobiopterin dehydratase n=1 Tax=uncultured Cytophaga sp. TaxID=160238 RepID=UPI00261194F8|nr:4a-hydroxytetrahydrobiopterin dehydratase [uncultured Cytophaga sp.]
MDKWTEQNNRLIKMFQFKDFKQAFEFMKQVAIVADKMDHHPYWLNCYNKVYMELNTHDKGGIVTEKDRQLASAIDSIEHESIG